MSKDGKYRGLLPDRSEIGTIDFEFDGVTYTLMTAITGFQRDVIRQEAMMIKVPKNSVDTGDWEERLPAYLNTARMNLLLKKTFITAWSHNLPLTERNLRRMTVEHDDAVIAKINELIPLQTGVEVDTPLEMQSSQSSEPQS